MRHRPASPHVLIVGGYLTEPLCYRPLRDRLRRRGAACVTVAPLHWPDWIAATFAGFGPCMLRTARSIRAARREADAPVIVIGHSAGGLLARLAMSEVPFEGRRIGVATDVGCLVTLGTPHRLDPRVWRDHPGVRVTRFLEGASPGAFFAPDTGYLTVGSSRVPATHGSPGLVLRYSINRIMREFVGQTDGIGGDGIVDNDMAQLRGVPHIELREALHGTFGAPWYGDDRIIDEWWPTALQTWRDALASRAAAAAGQPIRPAG